MYWFLRLPQDSPSQLYYDLNKIDEEVGLETLEPQARLTLVQQMLAWEQAKGQHLYLPNLKEQRFFMQNAFIKGISGGNRSGKTATCVIDVIAQCEGWHPMQRENLERLAEEAVYEWVRDLSKEHLQNKNWIKSPPVTARCVTVDFPNYVEKTVGPEYEKWATKELLHNVWYDNEKKRRISWTNGSFVDFMTFEQPLKAHGGSARHVIQFDEEPPKDIWHEGMMRVASTKGRMTLGMTAVEGVTWTEDQIWLRGESDDPDVFTMEMSTYENPMNTAEMIDRIKEQCRGDQTEIDIRIYGKRKARGGQVYKKFKPHHPYVVPQIDVPPDKGTLLMAIDPHPRTPHAVLWIWVDPDGLYHPLHGDKPNLYAVSELFIPGHIPYLAGMIRAKEKSFIERVHDRCWADPAAWGKAQKDQDEKSVEELLIENGIFPSKGSKDLAGGILKVTELMDIPEDREFPRLMICESCERLIWEKKNYRWPDARGKAAQNRGLKQRPVDKDDHLVECERRLVEVVVDEQYEIFNAWEEEMFKSPRIFTSQGEVDVTFPDPRDQHLVGIIDPQLGV